MTGLNSFPFVATMALAVWSSRPFQSVSVPPASVTTGNNAAVSQMFMVGSSTVWWR